MRHPTHAAFVHFPIALLGTSLLFDALGSWRAEPLFWAIAFWNIALGLALSLPTVGTGLADSIQVPEESPASVATTRHLLVMLSALFCYGLALFARGGSTVPANNALLETLTLEAVGLGLLMYGGWLGGELVYRHGVGRSD
ncbi:MAG TPA: DUF2231 domain-containing protein [Polyangiaceae bacterium]|nr:DUF2231 domain-containing protein [Polyangiaceae bacterium]